MSLLEEAQGLQRRAGATCSVQALLDRLGPSEQAELAEAIASPVQAVALSKALRARGHEVGDQSIARHRRGDCQCRVS